MAVSDTFSSGQRTLKFNQHLAKYRQEYSGTLIDSQWPDFFLPPVKFYVELRVITYLENMENLEKSGNSKVVREKSGKM